VDDPSSRMQDRTPHGGSPVSKGCGRIRRIGSREITSSLRVLSVDRAELPRAGGGGNLWSSKARRCESALPAKTQS
jgi:hypothetical protein